MTQSRNWCFTWNHPTEMIDFSIHPRITYAIYQHEIGEEGTDHFQGYVEFKNPATLGGCLLVLPHAHWEPRRGTKQQAIDYCRKEDTRIDGPWEYGNAKLGQGARNDLINLNEAIKEQKPLHYIKDNFPNEFYKYQRGIHAARQLELPERHFKTQVTLIYGPTGTGKSRYVEATYSTAYWKPPANLWWDNYQPEKHEVVVLDDYNYPWFKFDYLLRLLDRYPFQVEFKGGMTQLLAKEIIITCNKLPSDWYGKKCAEHMPALLRRIDNWCTLMDASDGLVRHGNKDGFMEYLSAYGVSPNLSTSSPASQENYGFHTKPTLYHEDDYQ